MLYAIPSDLVLAFTYHHFLGMATMKENRGKEVMDEGSRPDHPSAGDKGKTLSKNLDLGNLPSRRGKKAKHGSSKVGVV